MKSKSSIADDISVALAPEDRKVILDYAAQLEKRSGKWRGFRWAAVVCFMVGFGSLVGAFYLCGKMHFMVELPPSALKIPEKLDAKAITSTLEVLSAFNDAKLASLRGELYTLVKALISAGIGAALFAHVASNWNRDKRDKVVAKLLRSVATTDTGDKESGT